MFDNISGKIKKLAEVICWIGIILSSIIGIIMFSYAAKFHSDDYILSGFLYIIFGSLLSWIASFFMYGFGELIEKTTEIANNTGNAAPEPQNNADKDVSGSDYSGAESKNNDLLL